MSCEMSIWPGLNSGYNLTGFWQDLKMQLYAKKKTNETTHRDPSTNPEQ